MSFATKITAVPDQHSSLRSTSTGPQTFNAKLQTWDVICGVEKCFDLHDGNVRYHQILAKVRPSFLTMESKTAKKKLVRDVDDFIKGYGGRFLRVEEGTDRLRIMTTAESRNKISRSLRDYPAQQKNQKAFTMKISELDVMCGRGGKANHHLGNKIYRKLVCDMKEKYRSIADKDEKTEMSRSIVDQVLAYGGRFVRKDPGSGCYYLLTNTEARIKTSQALRENRDSKIGVLSDSDCDSDCGYTYQESKPTMVKAAKSLRLDSDSLDCCKALVSLSRAGSPALDSASRAA